MASASSNLDDVAAWIRGLVNAVDFTRPGAARLLGEECLDRIAERIQDRSVMEQGGADGQKWEKNAQAYVKTKRKKGKIIGVLTGEMLSDVQLQGTRTIESTRAEMQYGTTPEVRDKLSWFNKGSNASAPGEGRPSGALNQPPRQNLYMLDETAKDDVMAELGEFVDWLAANPDTIV